MARKYTKQTREKALETLSANQNNFVLTSQQTGVPERTLRDWRRTAGTTLVMRDRRTSDFHDRFPDTEAAVKHVVDQFMTEMIAFADDLPAMMQMAAPYHRMMMVVQMIDRMAKLKTLLPPEQMTIHIVREPRTPILNPDALKWMEGYRGDVDEDEATDDDATGE